MEKIIAVLLLLAAWEAMAQDTLVLNDRKIISLVLMLDEDSIRYRTLQHLDGPDLYIKNSEVKTVKYRSGKIVPVDSIFQLTLSRRKVAGKDSLPPLVDWNSAEHLYEKGRLHAEVHYKCNRKMIVYGIVGLATGVFVAIPALIDGRITPADNKLGYPDEDLWRNEHYRKGYRDMARRLKRRRVGLVASSFGMASIAGFTGIMAAKNQ